ncbi:PIF1-like helicase-domain-containing protein [Phycomyces blakesleeanus]
MSSARHFKRLPLFFDYYDDSLSDEQQQTILQRVLGDIQPCLQVTDHSLSEFPTMPQTYIMELETLSALQALKIVESRSYSSEEEQAKLDATIPIFNIEQKTAYDQIVESFSMSADIKQSRLFFVDSPDSTEKSLLFKTLLNYVRAQNEIALPVASSGIAAIILPDRKITHSKFKIPLNADINSTCNISLRASQSNLLQNILLFL